MDCAPIWLMPSRVANALQDSEVHTTACYYRPRTIILPLVPCPSWGVLQWLVSGPFPGGTLTRSGHGGTPARSGWGVPHPSMGLYPIPGWGYPLTRSGQEVGTPSPQPSQDRGVPHPRTGGNPSHGGGTPSQDGWYPEVPPARSNGGYPSQERGVPWGTPWPDQDKGIPHPRMVPWYPPPPILGWGTPPPPHRTMEGVCATRRAVCLLRSSRRTSCVS